MPNDGFSGSRINRVLLLVGLLIIFFVVIAHLVLPFVRLPGQSEKSKSDNTAAKSSGPSVSALSVAEIVKATRSSVVVIKTSSSVGSGFFINQRGDIATNKHVLPAGENAEIKTASGRIFKITGIIAEDAYADLAIASTDVPPDEITPVRMAGDLPEIGEKIIVIGSPFGLEQTVSDGIVSAIREGGQGIQVIQITAPVSPGNSGGPLLSMRGEVIGVATFQVKQGQNLNFCIASDRLIALLNGKEPSEVQYMKKDVYCFVNAQGDVSFVDWDSGNVTRISRSDGSIDRDLYVQWVYDKIGGNPNDFNLEKEANEAFERNKEELLRKTFANRVHSEEQMTDNEKNIWRYVKNNNLYEHRRLAILRKNEMATKYAKMMVDLEKFNYTRRRQ